MSKVKAILCAVILLLPAGTVYAGVNNVMLQMVNVGRNGSDDVYIQLRQLPLTPCYVPPSSDAAPYSYVFNLKVHPAGKEMYAALLFALANKRPVSIASTGICSVASGLEEVDFIAVWGY